MRTIKIMSKRRQKREINREKEAYQTEELRKKLKNKYDFSSENKRPRDPVERKILAELNNDR